METIIQQRHSANKLKRVGLVSTCEDDWGGCEVLWSRSLPLLHKKGVRTIVYKKKINFQHPQIEFLHENEVELKELDPAVSYKKEMAKKIKRAVARQFFNSHPYLQKTNTALENFISTLKADRPDLMIIAQSINFDGLLYAQACLQLKIPYLLIIQKAVDFYWPPAGERALMARCFQKAQKCFFVSAHNKNLTEEQFGIPITNSIILPNPVTIPIRSLPFPSLSPVIKLACVGRLFVLDKGQDILLRILARPKWRERPLTVSFAGSGVDEQGLKEMAALLNIKNVRFLGEVNDIEKLWQEHHALVLPSRSEGLPLCLLEAMAAGRPSIISRAGGNGEFITDEVNGFMGEANGTDFEDAMERAWNKRDQWAEIGQRACDQISKQITIAPEIQFAHHIMNML